MGCGSYFALAMLRSTLVCTGRSRLVPRVSANSFASSSVVGVSPAKWKSTPAAVSVCFSFSIRSGSGASCTRYTNGSFSRRASAAAEELASSINSSIICSASPRSRFTTSTQRPASSSTSFASPLSISIAPRAARSLASLWYSSRISDSSCATAA